MIIIIMSRLDSDVTLYICNVCLFYKTLPLDLCAFLEKLYSPALSVLRNIVYQHEVTCGDGYFYVLHLNSHPV